MVWSANSDRSTSFSLNGQYIQCILWPIVSEFYKGQNQTLLLCLDHSTSVRLQSSASDDICITFFLLSIFIFLREDTIEVK